MTSCNIVADVRKLMAGAVCLLISVTGGEVVLADQTDYRQRFSLSVKVDGQDVVLTRFERTSGVNSGLYGEHISTLTAADGRLMAFARMELNDAATADNTLPSKDRTDKIAHAYLREVAPDLLRRHKVLWIDKHEETIRVGSKAGGETDVVLHGMKVKCRDLQTGLYFWVIVGGNEDVMVFERDIRWITFPGRRGTEKWLHDAWLDEALDGKLPVS